MGANSLKIVLIEKDGGQKPEDMSVGDSITILLDGSEPIFIGRAPDADVLVQAPSVGRKVVAIWLGPDGVVVEDLGSGSGSLLEVSGVQTLRPSGLLPDKAILWIGQVAFQVELANEQ